MKKLFLKAPAKLNLNLHVLSQKTGKGLHQVRCLNCQLNLADRITLASWGVVRPISATQAPDAKPLLVSDRVQQNKIEVSCCFGEICRCDKKKTCRGKKNLILVAAELLKEKYGQADLEVRIGVDKQIPPASGLAGGSSDAAAVLRGLRKLWGLKDMKGLRQVGRRVGSDVSYCLVGGLCEVAGTGEKVKPLPFKMPAIPVVVVVPDQEKPSTAWAYGHLDLSRTGRSLQKLNRLKQALGNQDFLAVLHNLHNDFEPGLFAKCPVLGKIRQKMLKYGALSTLMVGSGLGMVGFFSSRTRAQTSYRKLKKEFKKVFLTITL